MERISLLQPESALDANFRAAHGEVLEPLRIESAADALELSQLNDVVYYKVSAERLPESSDTGEQVAAQSDQGQQRVDIAIQERHDADKLEVRCRLTVNTPEALYEVDAASRFEFSRPVAMADVALDDFVARVGVMAVYPYLRETLHSLASKLRLEAPVLGLLQGGAVSIYRADNGQGLVSAESVVLDAE